jgi:hypothetical protein
MLFAVLFARHTGPRFSPVCHASTRRPSLQPAPGRDSIVVPGGAPVPPE